MSEEMHEQREESYAENKGGRVIERGRESDRERGGRVDRQTGTMRLLQGPGGPHGMLVHCFYKLQYTVATHEDNHEENIRIQNRCLIVSLWVAQKQLCWMCMMKSI